MSCKTRKNELYLRYIRTDKQTKEQRLITKVKAVLDIERLTMDERTGLVTIDLS